MPTVERTHPQGKRKVIWLLTGKEFKLFARNLTKRHLPSSELSLTASYGLLYGLGRTIDSKNMSCRPATNNFARSDAWPTPNFKHTNAGPKRQRIDGFKYSRRYGDWHGVRGLTFELSCPRRQDL